MDDKWREVPPEGINQTSIVLQRDVETFVRPASAR